MTWELAGKFPDILQDPVVGEAARAVYADAQAMLKTLIDERWISAHGVVGFWRAQRSDTVRQLVHSAWLSPWLDDPSAVVLGTNGAAHALPFYARFGFIPDGPVFIEAGIPHQAMRRTLVTV